MNEQDNITRIFAGPKRDTASLVGDLELFLRPLVRILLLFRVSLPALIALVKKLYLEEATARLKRSGTPLNVPNLAFEAGCTDIALVADFLKGRRTTLSEIGSLAESRLGDSESAPCISLEAAVCERWRSDPLYQDNNGDPVALPVRGRQGRSFDGLVRRCVSGRMSYGPILNVLKQCGLVIHNAEDDTVLLQAVQSGPDSPQSLGIGVLPSPSEPLTGEIDGKTIQLNRISSVSPTAALAAVCRSISHLVTTCANNLELRMGGDYAATPFGKMQSEYYSTCLPPDKYWEFKSFTTRKLNQAIAEWVARTEQDYEDIACANPISAGFGVYFFDLLDDRGLPGTPVVS
ncbi:MAG: DUF6502 family protein [Xanthomonadales bacterium]|nr:DUF6502 family protein [Xanthomonadales bacterium]